MANQILLPAQVMSAQALVNSIPGKIKKVFFQTEVKSISNNDMIVGIIAYAAHKNSTQKWEIGSKVTATVDNSKPVQKFSIPRAFANNEWTVTNVSKKNKGENAKGLSIRKQQALAVKMLNRIANNKDLLKKTALTFKARGTVNPHLEYDVTIDTGLGTQTAYTNPSPPAPPSE